MRRDVACAASIVLAMSAGLGTGASMAAAGDPPFLLAGLADIRQVCQLTGPDAHQDTSAVKIAGTDLGSMFEAGGRTWFVFGDTFGQRNAGMTGGGGSLWRSNALAYTTDTDPTDCITFDGWITDRVGWAAELLASGRGEVTVIPTYGFEANGDMYLHYMSVRFWGDPGEWDTNLGGLAKSTDDGQTWQRLEDVTWPGTGTFQQVAVVKVDGELLFWGIPAGRLGGVSLMKVAEPDVEDLWAYRYLSGVTTDGEPEWSADPAAAILIIDRPTGELSVAWNEYLGRWLMTTMADNADAVMYEGVTPWGPWSEPHILYRQADLPGLYAPYMHPSYVADGGRTIYFGLSHWLPYNVFWHRVDLVRAQDPA
ncbi:MAG: DUF4185 domain-containing protein [Chloroflexi bacterium]|nr:DUF4185 domain-containing protein [Chloroflexota bacterium]